MKKTAIFTAALLLTLTGCSNTQNDPINSIPSPVSSGNTSTSENTSDSASDNTPGSSPDSAPDSAPDSSPGSTPGTLSEDSIPESDAPDNTEAPDKPPVPDKPPAPAQGGEMSDKVFVLSDGRAIDLYGGGYERGANYAASLNTLKLMVGDQVNVFSLVAPTAVSFYLPEEYSYMTGSEWDNIDYINENLNGVIPVDAYTALSKHVGEDIYFRTDHHWQPLGAYYAAEEFAGIAQVPFAPLSDYETVSKEGYVGTMYGYSGENPLVKNNPDTFTYYKPKNDYTTTYYTQTLENPYEGGLFLKTIDNLDTTQWYLVFMGGDGEVEHIHTDVGNGRKLVIVKDSYGNALVPCLTNSFEDIWVVDMRGFEKSISALVNSEGLTDVLFCMNSFSATGNNQYELENKL